ncbi:MAG TPA: T9SS type A sorting domain-containing protein [Flavobacterium alvei]|nr:T9SS type A sorting domain-containing protein [Flavobacterium alvei]
MKKQLFTILVFIMGLNSSFGQITLDHVYTIDPPDRYVLLNPSGLKYVSLHMSGQTYTYFNLYNPDHSLFKSINIPQFPGKNVNKIAYISETLFDTDTLIEFLVGYIYSGPGGISAIRVCNENGNILLERDTAGSGGYTGLLELGQGGQIIFPNGTNSKLIIGKSFYSGTWTNQTEIYTLPGQLPCQECTNGLLSSIEQVQEVEENGSSAYPNPFTTGTKIQYTLPPKFNHAFLNLYDINGKLIKTKEVDRNYNEVYITENEIKQGVYIYNIVVDGKVIANDKIVKL